jgi:hypothetical protein
MPLLWLMDPDPAIFVINLQDAKKSYFFKKFFAQYFLKVHLKFTLFFKDKESKVTKQ